MLSRFPTRRPSRRRASLVTAAVLGAAALAVIPAATATAVPAGALAPARDPGASHGAASAETAAVALDVRLLRSRADVPVSLTLNAVSAPATRRVTALTATVAGVQGGRSSLLAAKAGRTDAVVDRRGARASVTLTRAEIGVPGLAGGLLLSADAIRAQADCPLDGRPSASAELLGVVTVLGRHVDVSADGPSEVTVPGLGTVALTLTRHTATSDRAAATALEIAVDVNPGKLNVAEVHGSVTVAQARCESPRRARAGGGADPSPPTETGSPIPAPSTSAAAPAPTTTSAAAGTVAYAPSGAAGADPVRNQGLAETGGGSHALPIALGGAALVLVGGATALAAMRRRRG